MNKLKHLLTIAGVVFAAHLACSQPAPDAAPAVDPGTFSGKVIETTNSGGYTYILVDTGSRKIWAAAKPCTVKVGDTAAVDHGMPMANFQSKTMNRTFSEIYFTGVITVNGQSSSVPKLPAGHPDIGGQGNSQLPKDHPPIAGAATKPAPAKVDVSGIKPAKDGKTVSQICTDAAKLSGKTVILRGKVVKYNTGIMNKNWLHIQDGTGKPATEKQAASNDILVTSTDEAKLGDTVLITGKVTTKKDFGAGYKYDVLIEDAKVVVE